jgi:hypothetical protein
MSRTRVALTALGVAGIVACGSAPFTAPPGSSISLVANPPFVVANGGSSVVSAIVVEPAGTFVPDGVEVFFFTDLGTIERSGKTNAGVARVNFVSDSRSGTATVTAISGGSAPAPAASASPSTGGAVSSGTGTATVTIAIGSALPTRVLVSADPTVMRSTGWSNITANVFDDNGNPVAHVPVIFSVSGGSTDGTVVGVGETLDSGGRQLFTDTNGQAFDVLRSRRPLSESATVTVTATTANGISGTVPVSIN